MKMIQWLQSPHYPKNNIILDVIFDLKPGIALTDSKVSAMCCNRFEQDGEKSECGKVTRTTAFEDLAKLFRDLIKESICHSCDNNFYNVNTRAYKIRSQYKRGKHLNLGDQDIVTHHF